MPNRVDGTVSGVRPSTAVRPEARQANRADQAAQQNPPEAPAQDRVDISEQARLREEQARPRAGAADNTRGAADNAPGAPEAGDQGRVNDATAQRAAQLREEQTANEQQAQTEPPERQGNLVDVVG